MVRFNASSLATTFDPLNTSLPLPKSPSVDASGNRRPAAAATTAATAAASSPARKVDLVTALAAIPPERVAALQRGVDAAAKLLRYALPTNEMTTTASQEAGSSSSTSTSTRLSAGDKEDAFSALISVVRAAYGTGV